MKFGSAEINNVMFGSTIISKVLLGSSTIWQKIKTIVYDSFNRANNSTSLGNAETGQTWQNVIGTWGISNNQAYSVSIGNNDMAVIDAGVSNANLYCDVSINYDGEEWILLRYLDTNNYLMCGIDAGMNCKLYKKVNGSYTALGSFGTATNNLTYSFKIALSSDNIIIYVNNVQKLSVNVSEHINNTKYGIRNGSSYNAKRFDNFKVEG